MNGARKKARRVELDLKRRRKIISFRFDEEQSMDGSSL